MFFQTNFNLYLLENYFSQELSPVNCDLFVFVEKSKINQLFICIISCCQTEYSLNNLIKRNCFFLSWHSQKQTIFIHGCNLEESLFINHCIVPLLFLFMAADKWVWITVSSKRYSAAVTKTGILAYYQFSSQCRGPIACFYGCCFSWRE